MTYLTREGEMLDEICYAHYQREEYLAAVYDANPGLAGYGNILPINVTVILPDLPPPPQQQSVRLWGSV